MNASYKTLALGALLAVASLFVTLKYVDALERQYSAPQSGAVVSPGDTFPSFNPVPATDALVDATAGGPAATTVKPGKTILLTAKNTLSVRGPVTEQRASFWQEKAMELSASLNARDVIYVVLDTPGGSVEAGYNYVDTLKALPNKINTISLFAASMGFHMVQNLGTRYILPSGTVMSHRASISGLGGTIPGSADATMKYLGGMVSQADSNIAARLGLSLPAYYNLIKDEFWAYGQDAKNAKFVDEVILARCDADLVMSESVETFSTFLGDIEVTFSQCPLIRAPKKISLDKLFIAADEKQFLQNLLQMYFSSPRKFTEEFVITGKYKQFLQ